MAMSSVRAVIVVALSVTSCGTPHNEVPRVRFANAPPVTVVDDRRPVSGSPEKSQSLLELDYLDRSVATPLFNTLSLPNKRRARGVNALDEVPDSTWFTNRIGVHDMTPEQIARGPVEDEGPEPHTPWTIRGTKSGGTEPGFIITDARGIKYGIAFDSAERPELETGTAVVVNRLLWACGYNVPEDRVAYVRPEDLVVARDAPVRDSQGRKLRRLDREAVDRVLAKAWKTPDGRIRVLASRWLAGESLGGTPPAGVRRGDLNDRIPHQDRRDLRGQYPLFAWVQHVDLVQANFLDMLITPDSDSSRRYVVHYLIDFGRDLGVLDLAEQNIRANDRYLVDWSEPVLTFGIAPRAWGHHWAPTLTGVSPTFVATDFDPGAWRPVIPYAPFDAADRFDMFWGAKILARFTPAQIRAAVEAAQFSDPRTVEYLTNTLVARQRATVAYWYARVNPLDKFTATAGGLCFEDLAITAQLASPGQTRYELASYDRAERPLGRVVIDGVPGAAAICTGSVKLANAGDGYTIVKITTSRPAYTGSTAVHLARDGGTGAWRVIGVWRM
jgi:hypothetical protein